MNNDNPNPAAEENSASEIITLQQIEEQMTNDKIEEANRELQEYHESMQYKKEEDQFWANYRQFIAEYCSSPGL